MKKSRETIDVEALVIRAYRTKAVHRLRQAGAIALGLSGPKASGGGYSTDEKVDTSSFSARVAARTLDASVARFAAAPARTRQAMAQGLNKSGDLERTQIRRVLRQQTGVFKAGTITSHTGTKRAHAGSLEYTITDLGKGLSIKEFPVSAGAGSPGTARPWRVAHRFERSFRTSRKGLLRARRGASRFPIRALYGPSVAKEIVKDESASEFNAHAGHRVEAAVIKQLGRMLP